MLNMNMLPHKSRSGKYTSRTNKELNDEFNALKMCIEQIPDTDESTLEENDAKNTSKFNHIYVQDAGHPCSSDINEDLSIL